MTTKIITWWFFCAERKNMVVTGGFSTGPGTARIVTPSGQAVGSAYVAPAPQRIVAGASTGPTTNPTPAPTPTAPSGGNGGGPNPQDLAQQISDLYQPALDTLTQAEGAINQGYNTDVTNLNSSVSNLQDKTNTESAQLLGEQDTSQAAYNKTLQSAYAQAVRDYNALQQQGRARFGAGNSAGQAVGELAQQEYFRQQGNLNDKQTTGDLQFAAQRAKINTYIKQKFDDLDLYKQQALGELKKNLNSDLLSIAQRRGDIEANKTKDRINALQNAVAQTQAIQNADATFRNNIMTQSLALLQQTTGRTFTPAEIVAYMQEFQNQYMNSGYNPSAGATAAPVTPVVGPTAYNPNNDILNQLNPLQGGGNLG